MSRIRPKERGKTDTKEAFKPWNKLLVSKRRTSYGNDAANSKALTRHAEKYRHFTPSILHRHLVQNLSIEKNIEHRSHRLYGSLILADISGFTRLSSRLSADELKQHINAYFTLLIGVVRKHRGDVVKFLGDAVLILFHYDINEITSDIKEALALMASICAIELVKYCGSYNEGEGRSAVSLKLHCGVSIGILYSMYVGTQDRWEYIISGDPLTDVGEVTSHAESGEVCVTEEVFNFIRDDLEVRKATKGGYLLTGKRSTTPFLPVVAAGTTSTQGKRDSKSRLDSINLGNFVRQRSNPTLESVEDTSPKGSISSQVPPKRLRQSATADSSDNAISSEKVFRATRSIEFSTETRPRRSIKSSVGISSDAIGALELNSTDGMAGVAAEGKQQQRVLSSKPGALTSSQSNSQVRLLGASRKVDFKRQISSLGEEKQAFSNIGGGPVPPRPGLLRQLTRTFSMKNMNTTDIAPLLESNKAYDTVIEYLEEYMPKDGKEKDSSGNSSIGSSANDNLRSNTSAGGGGSAVGDGGAAAVGMPPKRLSKSSRRILGVSPTTAPGGVLSVAASATMSVRGLVQYGTDSHANDPVLSRTYVCMAMRSFVHPAARGALESTGSRFLFELRNVTTIFVELLGLQEDQRLGNVDRFQQVMEIGVSSLYRYGGSLRQFTVDDKGCVLIGAFGLPGSSHEDNCRRAIEATVSIRERLHLIELNCRCGISEGRVFCGLVGCDERCEYAMMGASVNLAARLMANSTPGNILVSESVFKSTKSKFAFLTLPRMYAKGYQDLVAVFQPTERLRGNALLGSEDADEAKKEVKFVGREEELRLLVDALCAARGGLHFAGDRGSAFNADIGNVAQSPTTSVVKRKGSNTLVLPSSRIALDDSVGIAGSEIPLGGGVGGVMGRNMTRPSRRSTTVASSRSYFIEGVAGVGKSRLVAEALKRSSSSATPPSGDSDTAPSASGRLANVTVVSPAASQYLIPYYVAREIIEQLMDLDLERTLTKAEETDKFNSGNGSRRVANNINNESLHGRSSNKLSNNGRPAAAVAEGPRRRNSILHDSPLSDATGEQILLKIYHWFERTFSKEDLSKPIWLAAPPSRRTFLYSINAMDDSDGESKDSDDGKEEAVEAASPSAKAAAAAAAACAYNPSSRVGSIVAFEPISRVGSYERPPDGFDIMSILPLLGEVLRVSLRDTPVMLYMRSEERSILTEKLLQFMIINCLKEGKTDAIIVDNLQWCDSKSLSLLSKCIVSLPHIDRGVIICTSRIVEDFAVSGDENDDFEQVNAITPSVHLQPRKFSHQHSRTFSKTSIAEESDDVGNYRLVRGHSNRITLKPFNEAEVLAVITNVIGSKLVGANSRIVSDANISLILERSGGLPAQVLLLVAGVVMNKFDDVEKLEDLQNVPMEVQDLIVARFDKLSKSEQLILKIASVIGNEFTVTLTEDIVVNLDLKIDTKDLGQHLNNLKQANLIAKVCDQDQSYRFVNFSIQECTYGLMTSELRARIHRVCGEALESMYLALQKQHVSVEEISAEAQAKEKGILQEIFRHFLNGDDVVKRLYYLKLGVEKDLEDRNYISAFRRLQDLIALSVGGKDYVKLLDEHVKTTALGVVGGGAKSVLRVPMMTVRALTTRSDNGIRPELKDWVDVDGYRGHVVLRPDASVEDAITLSDLGHWIRLMGVLKFMMGHFREGSNLTNFGLHVYNDGKHRPTYYKFCFWGPGEGNDGGTDVCCCLFPFFGLSLTYATCESDGHGIVKHITTKPRSRKELADQLSVIFQGLATEALVLLLKGSPQKALQITTRLTALLSSDALERSFVAAAAPATPAATAPVMASKGSNSNPTLAAARTKRINTTNNVSISVSPLQTSPRSRTSAPTSQPTVEDFKNQLELIRKQGKVLHAYVTIVCEVENHFRSSSPAAMGKSTTASGDSNPALTSERRRRKLNRITLESVGYLDQEMYVATRYMDEGASQLDPIRSVCFALRALAVGKYTHGYDFFSCLSMEDYATNGQATITDWRYYALIGKAWSGVLEGKSGSALEAATEAFKYASTHWNIPLYIAAIELLIAIKTLEHDFGSVAVHASTMRTLLDYEHKVQGSAKTGGASSSIPASSSHHQARTHTDANKNSAGRIYSPTSSALLAFSFAAQEDYASAIPLATYASRKLSERMQGSVLGGIMLFFSVYAGLAILDNVEDKLKLPVEDAVLDKDRGINSKSVHSKSRHMKPYSKPRGLLSVDQMSEKVLATGVDGFVVGGATAIADKTSIRSGVSSKDSYEVPVGTISSNKIRTSFKSRNRALMDGPLEETEGDSIHNDDNTVDDGVNSIRMLTAYERRKAMYRHTMQQSRDYLPDIDVDIIQLPSLASAAIHRAENGTSKSIDVKGKSISGAWNNVNNKHGNTEDGENRLYITTLGDWSLELWKSMKIATDQLSALSRIFPALIPYCLTLKMKFIRVTNECAVMGNLTRIDELHELFTSRFDSSVLADAYYHLERSMLLSKLSSGGVSGVLASIGRRSTAFNGAELRAPSIGIGLSNQVNRSAVDEFKNGEDYAVGGSSGTKVAPGMQLSISLAQSAFSKLGTPLGLLQASKDRESRRAVKEAMHVEDI